MQEYLRYEFRGTNEDIEDFIKILKEEGKKNEYINKFVDFLVPRNECEKDLLIMKLDERFNYLGSKYEIMIYNDFASVIAPFTKNLDMIVYLNWQEDSNVVYTSKKGSIKVEEEFAPIYVEFSLENYFDDLNAFVIFVDELEMDITVDANFFKDEYGNFINKKVFYEDEILGGLKIEACLIDDTLQ